MSARIYCGTEEERRAAAMQVYRDKHRQAIVRRNYKQRLKSYGITEDDYNVLLKQQGYVCAICHQSETALSNLTKQIQRLAVDHDHITGEVRGLLCQQCNIGLGHFKDDADLLTEALVYLEKTS